MGDPTALAARVLYPAPPSWRVKSLNTSPAGHGDLADQVAAKRFNGSRLGAFFSGLLRLDNERDRGPSWSWGDLEAGGRTSAAAGRVRARLNLDAVFPVPKGSGRKI